MRLTWLRHQYVGLTSIVFYHIYVVCLNISELYNGGSIWSIRQYNVCYYFLLYFMCCWLDDYQYFLLRFMCCYWYCMCLSTANLMIQRGRKGSLRAWRLNVKFIKHHIEKNDWIEYTMLLYVEHMERLTN